MILTATYPAGVLTLDDDHVYRLNGMPYDGPSNTQVLKDMGIIDTTYYNMDAAWRGTAVHEMTALYDEYEGDFHWPSVDSSYVGYVRGWEKFILESGFKPCAGLIEKPVLGAGYCTTIDRVGILNGRCVVLEIKTGICPKWVGLQTAMQYDAVVLQRATLGVMPVGRVVLGVGSSPSGAVELRKNGTYKLVQCMDRSDMEKSRALVSAWHTRKEYRGDVPW